MTNKEKQIEEMAKIIAKFDCNCCDDCAILCDKCDDFSFYKEITKELYNAGYFKGGKDEEVAVVSEDLPPKDQEKERSIDEKIAKACKETAREILQELSKMRTYGTKGDFLYKIDKLAEKYGVEVE